jgi:CBS domain-containing protein
MSRVRDILAAKGAAVHAVPPAATVHEAIECMVRHNIGAVLVTSGKEVVGIFTERDHLRRVTLPNLDPRTATVAGVMTRRVVYVDPDRTVEDCMTIMTQERIRHLPVLQDGAAVGMISIGDVVNHVAQQREVEVRSLTAYITGS